jgi:hypothetical protein
MLQGIGTIIGAVAVIVAAIIGGGTLRSWRRQQLLQRHMDLADCILTLAVRAKDEIRSIRSPLKTSSELTEAGKTLEANGFVKAAIEEFQWRRLESAQATHMRVDFHQTTWTDLQSIKHSAYVYFGEDISKHIEAILHQVHVIRVDADAYAYAEGDGGDQEFGKKLMQTLSWGRARGNADELGNQIDNAVSQIELKFRPLLRDVASATQKAFIDALAEALRRGFRNSFPF